MLNIYINLYVIIYSCKYKTGIIITSHLLIFFKTDLVIPLEIWCDGELHFQSGACDWLQMNCQVQLWELMDVLMNGLPHLWHADQLT